MTVTTEKDLFTSLTISFLRVHAKVQGIALESRDDVATWLLAQSKDKTTEMRAAIMQAMRTQDKAQETIDANYDFVDQK